MQASEPAQSATKKGSMTMLWEYAVKSAVSHQELTEHEGHQVMQCWNETDQLQDNAEKHAKFKKLLGMKFGPSKGNTVHDLMVKRRDQTIQMVQQKQQQKRQQQQGMSNNTVDLTGGASASQVPSQQPQFQQQQGHGQSIQHAPQNSVPGLQQSTFNYSQQTHPGNSSLLQQQQFAPQGTSSYSPMNVNNVSSVQQPGTFNTFNTLPPGATGFGGQGMGNGPLLAPNSMGSGSGSINGSMMNLSGGYTGNTTQPQNLASGTTNLLSSSLLKSTNVIFNNSSHLQNPGSSNMSMPLNTMNNNMNSSMPMMNNNHGNTNILNSAANLAAQAANNAKKPTPKRTAGKAGLDDATGDKKSAKKRNPPAKPSVPGQVLGTGMIQGQLQGQIQGQMQNGTGTGGMGGFPGLQQQGLGHQGMSQGGMPGLPAGLNTNPNRPLNTPGGAGYYAGYTGATGGASSSNLSGMQASVQQPPTVAQEIEGMTERMNSAQEGIEPAGDNALSAPLSLPQDFLRNETDLAREKLRLGLSAAVGLNLPGAAGGANRFQTGGGFGAGGATAGGPSLAQHEAMQPWQYHNIVDKGIMARAAVHVLEGRDLKIGVPSLNALSTGIQQHLKNVLEAAFKTSKSRINRTALNSYEGISRMIVEHGKGHALPENQQNIAIRWSEDVRSILQSEELAARKSLKTYDNALEESLQEKMKAFDEERGKTGNKRKLGDADIPWWTKEDGAEKAGLLGWSDLAMVSFKNSVARKHELGAHAHSSKKGRNSLPGRSHVAPSKTSDDVGATSGVVSATGAQGSAGSAVAAAVSALSSQNGNTGESSAAPVTVDWSRQPCPLTLPRTNQVTLLEEDLAGTLARSSGSRALPNTGVLSSTRTTGTCLYKWKMGVYTGAAATNL